MIAQALVLLFLFPAVASALGLHSPSDDGLISVVRNLYAGKHWEEIVRFVQATPDHPAEFDYYDGLALAQLQRWDEAKQALRLAQRKSPLDKRFPVELAGIAFKQKRYREAEANLRRALHLAPQDHYANDFLATLYFLDGNLPAALCYWNRIGKPVVEEIRIDPQPLVDPVLLDRVFTFSRSSLLQLEDFRSTEARLGNLDIVPRYRFELQGRPDETFDLLLHAVERNGWGANKVEGLVSLLRGVPYQTVYPEWFNLRHSAMNFTSLVRWDAQKRRLFASLAAPLRQDPKWRWQVYLDGRNENWDISKTFYGSTVPLTDLKVQKVEAGAQVRSIINGRWSWQTGVDFSYRKFPNLGGKASEAAAFFRDGVELKYDVRFDAHLLRIPQKRITLDSTSTGQLGKMFVESASPFARLQNSVNFRWFPQSRGNDYQVTGRFRAGKMIGQTAFDELFMLGLERDNDLWLRAHVGTRDSRKGAAPLGREYLLLNWDAEKRIYANGFLQVKIGPFVDSGKIYDESGFFGSREWLWDTGVECKVRVLSGPNIVFFYGRDLAGGRHAFYATNLP